MNISSAAAYLQQPIFSLELLSMKLIYLTTEDISGLQFPLFCSKQTIYFSLMLNIEWNDWKNEYLIHTAGPLNLSE